MPDYTADNLLQIVARNYWFAVYQLLFRGARVRLPYDLRGDVILLLKRVTQLDTGHSQSGIFGYDSW